MPELPEVETVARGVAKYADGQRIAALLLHRPEMLHGNAGPLQQLTGRRIKAVTRCGKQIRLSLSVDNKSQNELTMFVHLGMTGRLFVVDDTAPVEKHTHLQIRFARRRFELRFVDPRRFGGIWLVAGTPDGVNGKGCNQDWSGRRLPPTGADPLELALDSFRGMLQRRRQIKALLLDQAPISGIGNIYCDETLFRIGIHPMTLACDLNPRTVRQLWQTMRRVLREAIRAGGSTISDYRDAHNQLGRFQTRHQVYGRAGQPCRRCRTPIERLMVAGRGTHICPNCQPH